jgi:pimeloyl-ACP methyl ester carboxylesterase
MKKLLLLHGALGSEQQFDELKKQLEKNFEIYTLNFSGHGGNPLPPTPFSIPLFANEVMQFIDKNNLAPADIFGYSMGGYVSLYIACHYPEYINRMMTLATKFSWTRETAAAEVRMLNPNKIEEKIPAFASQLKLRHAPADWKEVMQSTAEMMLRLGESPALTDEDFKQINHTILLSIGDEDKMVSVAETEHVHHLIKNSRVYIFEKTQHPVEKADIVMLKEMITNFF